MTTNKLLLCTLVSAAGLGCSASGGSSASGSSAPKSSTADAATSYSSGAGGTYGAAVMVDAARSSGTGGSAIVLPAESGQKVSFLTPQAGANFVYIANPSRNTVTAIQAKPLGITEVAPGDTPTYLATVPGKDIALVVNVGSHTLSVIAGSALSASGLDVIAKANTIAVAPDGLHAVVWFDASQVTSTSTTSSTSTGSTQEVSVVDLSSSQPSTISMTVGYNPSAVVFSSDGSAAFVVTDDGIFELRFANITTAGIAPFTRINQNSTALASVDAGGPDTLGSTQATGDDAGQVTPDAGTVALDGGGQGVDGGDQAWDGGSGITDAAPDLTTANPDTRIVQADTSSTTTTSTAASSTAKPVDVSVTADGAYAVARRDGSADLLLVNLKTHTVSSLTLSSPITDLEIVPSGEAAFAVLRGEGKLVRVDIPLGFTDSAHQTTWQFSGAIVGSIAVGGKGRYAVLYTTAVASQSLVILDQATAAYQVVDLHMTVRAVAIAPDENTALVVHNAGSASGTGGSGGGGGSSGTSTSKTYGYTVVRLSDGFNRLQQTAALPTPFAITPTSSHVFVLLRDDTTSVRQVERMELSSFLVDDFTLGSPPDSIGVLPSARQVFVGQVYDEGRISLIDWTTDQVQSVTGFALNGRIQQ